MIWQIILFFLCIFGYIIYSAIQVRKNRRRKTIGILHPYSNAGGGGERVLWIVVKKLIHMKTGCKIVIYTGDTETKEETLEKTKKLFGIDMIGNEDIEFVRLNRRKWIEAVRYPVLTLLGQLLGSMAMMMEALKKCSVPVLIDTHGQAAGYWFAKLSGIRVVAYVHYPFISTDMIKRVREMRPSYNNNSTIAKAKAVSHVKVFYYKILLFLYSAIGSCCDLALCNSSWTRNHIQATWKTTIKVLYPPCDIKVFLNIPLSSPSKHPMTAISIGQFRPEKDHELQLRSLSLLIQKNQKFKNSKLLLVGSCRNEEDIARVNYLRQRAQELGIEKQVEFHLNVSFADLLSLVETSTVGLHSMWNEHFGISVVEMMAAGLITIANNSGGPKEDIIKHKVTGLLASQPEEYADCLEYAFENYESLESLKIQARQRVSEFSEENFEEEFQNNIINFLP